MKSVSPQRFSIKTQKQANLNILFREIYLGDYKNIFSSRGIMDRKLSMVVTSRGAVGHKMGKKSIRMDATVWITWMVSNDVNFVFMLNNEHTLHMFYMYQSFYFKR